MRFFGGEAWQGQKEEINRKKVKEPDRHEKELKNCNIREVERGKELQSSSVIQKNRFGSRSLVRPYPAPLI